MQLSIGECSIKFKLVLGSWKLNLQTANSMYLWFDEYEAIISMSAKHEFYAVYDRRGIEKSESC